MTRDRLDERVSDSCTVPYEHTVTQINFYHICLIEWRCFALRQVRRVSIFQCRQLHIISTSISPCATIWLRVYAASPSIKFPIVCGTKAYSLPIFISPFNVLRNCYIEPDSKCSNVKSALIKKVVLWPGHANRKNKVSDFFEFECFRFPIPSRWIPVAPQFGFQFEFK